MQLTSCSSTAINQKPYTVIVCWWTTSQVCGPLGTHPRVQQWICFHVHHTERCSCPHHGLINSSCGNKGSLEHNRTGSCSTNSGKKIQTSERASVKLYPVSQVPSVLMKLGNGLRVSSQLCQQENQQRSSLTGRCNKCLKTGQRTCNHTKQSQLSMSKNGGIGNQADV